MLRCKNAGSTYEASDVQWTCTASLPPDFRLGATDVICEGYSGPEDAQVLKGSCGVEYRLLLTREGEERFGKGSGEEGGWGGDGAERGVNVLFWVIFFGIIGWVLWALWRNRGEGLQGRPLGGGGGGGWGGGGGGGHDDGDDDPPPPYDYRPEQKPDPSREAQGWRPGFWSGLAGGAAAGYLANQRRQAAPPATGPSNWFNNRGRSSGSGSSSGSTGYSSTSYESTGFGSSSRR